MKLLKTYVFLLLGISLINNQLNAQDATAAVSIEESLLEEIPVIVEAEEKPSFTVSGFVDGYYMYNFNKVGLETSFTDRHDQFTLGMANVVLAKEGKVGFVADLAVGPRAEAANGVFDEMPTLSIIKQLYVTYTPVDAVTFTFGNFSTFVGYELIDAPGNVNYSTSYLFSNGPFYHTGIKADFAIADGFGAMVGLFNDTDDKFDGIPGKHFGAQLSAEVGGLSAYLNFLYGKEEELGDKDLNEFEIDLTATYTLSEKVMLGLNVANYSTSFDGNGQNGFLGVALYSTIQATETFAIGLRAEQFMPTDGEDATDEASITALTASGNIKIGNLTFIPEFRIDLASEDVFFDDKEMAKGSTGGFILAAVYAF
ncbi:MAG: hypothetical protein DHS20C18_09390 [Saprospiraceae bacterium]|nr:MAG: hypothetical protein DHS20C18_09390 [Saprospiraceae bacterium]